MEDDQQFCLRWNNHQTTLISVFDTLLENETLVDCTLAAEGKLVKAHKVVLSACSPYFATLLQEQYDKHPIFILKDVKYQELRAMMDYMYRGEVNISQDQLAALLKAAESLQIKGLSDNNRGGNGTGLPKHDQQQQQHRGGLNMPGMGGIGGAGKHGSGYTLEQTKRARMGPASMESQELSASREGSSSPTNRRRRKIRRRSIDNAIPDTHENSNSSQIPQNATALSLQQQQQSNANLVGVGAITAAASALAASQVPATMQQQAGSGISATAAVASGSSTQQLSAAATGTKKTESAKTAAGQTELGSELLVQAGTSAGHLDEQQQQDALKAEKSNHKQQKSAAGAAAANAGAAANVSDELVIQPKSEYDDEGHDENVEDLTLDDEEGMEDLDQNAGTSHGINEGSSQGYAQWQHDRSQDEVFMATQEAQQRDPQGCTTSSSSTVGSSQTPPPPNAAHSASLIRDYWYELKFSDLFKFINPDGRYQCPRYNCHKSYKDASSLQRHIRYECGGQKKFRCLMCGKAFSQSSHLKRHLESGVCVKYYL